MDPNNSQPTGENPNINKLEEDLEKLTKEAAATMQPVPEAPVQAPQEQPVPPQPMEIPTPPAEPMNVPAQPIETPPAPPNVPVESAKKGMSLMTIAMTLLIISVVVAVGYVAYTKFMTPSTPAVVVPVPTPTAVPIPEATLQASTSATPDPTLKWKTYTDTTYGFSFKYPERLSGTQAGVAPPYTGTSKEVQSFSDPASVLPNSDAAFDGFSLYIVTDQKATSFETYLSNEKTAMDNSPMAFMAGATRENFEGGDSYIKDNRGYYYLPSKDNKVVIVFAYIQSNPEFKTTFKNILSTFKFTSVTPSATPR